MDCDNEKDSKNEDHLKEDSDTNEEDEVDTEATKDANLNKMKKKVPGIVYLSSIPTKMNVKLIKDYLSDFGEVDRIFLQPEEKKQKKGFRMFSEGWVEFKNKKHAKLVAKKLNRQLVGGKRKNPWYEELWNIKYLKNFRWTHLNERLAYENESRKQRLRQEVTLAKKEANFYIRNFEKGEKQKRLDKKMKKQTDVEVNNDQNDENKLNVSHQNEDNNDIYSSKRPKFEHKIKVSNNENFLKQVFS